MVFSVLLAGIGIVTAWQFYVTKPDISARLARDWSGAHRTLTNKYYVDEFYDASIVRGTLGGGRNLWGSTRPVVDGAVDGSGWVTRVSSWISPPVRQVGRRRPRQPGGLGDGRIELRRSGGSRPA